jgi:propionyl-CoA carboxylase alpha chain
MIRRLLVANRGEIARRVLATCRSLGIETVAVYADPDAEAPYVTEADLAVHLPGVTPAETYLRSDLLVEAARRTGADAVHPGYGFLAEDAGFAAALTAAGLTWVGPPPRAIASMGSKIEAKALVAASGVPMLPTWTDAAAVTDFPVLVKAAAGGGGRGLRLVRDAEALDAALAAAAREATSAFGDGTVFIERYVERARHIEVQILADAHGNVVALGERECSIQRRHQKIIEETPSPAVGPGLRTALEHAAVAAARAVGYVGAGTVEFLVTAEEEFFFLEMNTRLQVEHPVTEAVTGLDLVRLQLSIAEGAPLPFVVPPPSCGHAVEVRLCAEEPANDWRPATGALHRLRVPGVDVEFAPQRRPGLRLDSGVRDGSVIGVYYDSMLAKLIAWAPTRGEAVRMLAGALARTRLHGVATNRDLLVRVLRHPAFGAGETDTTFLSRHPEVFAPLVTAGPALRLACLAAALAGAAARRAAAPVLASLPSGWRNLPSAPQRVDFATPAGPVRVTYRLDRAGALVGSSARWLDAQATADPVGQPPPEETDAEIALLRIGPERVALAVAGIRHDFDVHRVNEIFYVDGPDGAVTLAELPRFPVPAPETAEGSLVAPLPGTVTRVLVANGQRVTVGEALLTLEAMKLEHPVVAPHAGVVTGLPVAVGSQVDSGTLLAVISADEAAPVTEGPE